MQYRFKENVSYKNFKFSYITIELFPLMTKSHVLIYGYNSKFLNINYDI